VFCVDFEENIACESVKRTIIDYVLGDTKNKRGVNLVKKRNKRIKKIKKKKKSEIKQI